METISDVINTFPVADLSDEALATLRDMVAAEIARRESQALPTAQYSSTVRDGCVDQEELGGYEKHRRGKNWVATVVSDKTQPGGLRRSFWEKASGTWVHLPSGLKAGDVLEVAHEYVTGRGRNDKGRNYVVVVALAGGELYFNDCVKPN